MNNIVIIIIVSIGYSYCVSYRIDYIGIDYIKVLISLTLLQIEVAQNKGLI